MTESFDATALTLNLDGDGAWPDLLERGYQGGKIVAVTGLEAGMTSGKPSVTLRIELNDVFDRTDQKQTILAETSLALFLTVADALKAKYGDPRQ